MTMSDKDTDKLFGNPELLICDANGEMKPIGKVVENSIELDKLSVRENMLTEPLKIKPISINFDMPCEDIASFMRLDLASEPSKQVCSLVIQSKPKINKPKNLKYPNKKRARRIWKKWKRRFGETPGKAMYFPEVEIEAEMANEQYGFPYLRVKAKPINSEQYEHKD